MLHNQNKKHNYKENEEKFRLPFFIFFLLRSNLLWITFIFILATACNTTEPPPKVINGTAELTVEDVSSTEAWLNVKLQNINLPAELKLFREDSVIQIINLSSADTLLYDEGLQPNQTYTYHSIIPSFQNSAEVKSNNANLTTMDTTSHNFTWQTYTFGGANGSSVLNDVAIINENDIWAVGEIHTAETDQFDSNGVWVQPYNAVHWDGSSWELKRVYYKSGFWTIHSVFTFSMNDIWFDAFVHWNGESFRSLEIPDILIGWRINSMWGTSNSDFYVVGNNGNIAHYNGSNWTKIESGTDLNINDIWGSYNNKTDTWEILAVASNVFSSLDRAILNIDTNTQKVTQLPTQPINGTLSSVWFKPNSKYFVTGGGGNFEKYNLSEINWKHSIVSILRYSILKIRGNELNDIFGAGGGGEVLHFNGKTTKSYYNIAKLVNGNYYSIAVKNNLVIAVGEDNPTAVILIGNR